MANILCSTGAIITRKNNRNHKLIKSFAPQIHCDGFEFMMYDTWYEKWEQIVDDVIGMDLNFPLFHIEKQVGEFISRGESGDIEQANRLFEINCQMAQRIGANKAVLHLWSGIPSDRCIETNIRQFAVLDEIAGRYGLLLTVENVPCNHENPLLHFERLHAAYPDITFTFDVKFAQFHGELATAFSEAYAWLWDSAVQHLHISDYGGEYMEWPKLESLHIGEGRIDFAKLSQNLARVGYANTVTLESSSVQADGTPDFVKLNRSLDYLRENCLSFM
ncbi:MAG: sugar phosphate isomerase/epimerase [Lachnospiraceae bacterium]|nr:sugar phosphate isomerase/epimerase [Lachnospiraceae bacterium]